MDILHLLDQIDKADPEFQDRISPRRDVIKNMAGFGTKVAAASLPIFFSTLLKKAYGQNTYTYPSLTAVVIPIFNFALKLEYLESAFYTAGLNNSTLTAGLSKTELAYLTEIQAHELAHVAFLQSILGSNAIAQSSQGTNGVYDFTGKGTFPTVMTNTNTFLTVACAFEDTGVRAYKGSAATFSGQQTYMTALLDIHSVEGRHASAIRQLLYSRYLVSAATGLNLKPWITGANDTNVAAVAANYAGEDTTTQLGINILSLPALSGTTSTTAATEAFDQPLDMATVLGLVAPFGVV